MHTGLYILTLAKGRLKQKQLPGLTRQQESRRPSTNRCLPDSSTQKFGNNLDLSHDAMLLGEAIHMSNTSQAQVRATLKNYYMIGLI
jgi:hypothetical protein